MEIVTMYEQLGVSRAVYEYGEAVLRDLRPRFDVIDQTAAVSYTHLAFPRREGIRANGAATFPAGFFCVQGPKAGLFPGIGCNFLWPNVDKADKICYNSVTTFEGVFPWQRASPRRQKV